MINTLFILIIISREGGETGVWENRARVGWGMQERKRGRGGSSKRVGSRRNSCRGKLCNNAWYFGTENRLKEGSQWEKGQGYCTRGGRFGPPSLPYKCTCKNTSKWIQSKISFALRSNYDWTISHSNFTFNSKSYGPKMLPFKWNLSWQTICMVPFIS